MPLAVAAVEPRGQTRWALVALAMVGATVGAAYYLASFFAPACWIERPPVPVKSPRAAIDRYVAERNADFRANPERAGSKIRGDERVLNSSQDGQNRENRQYR